MSGTEHFPTINERGESFTPDPHRWPRIRATAAVLAVLAAGAGTGWWWTGEPTGAVAGAVCLTVLTAAVVIVPAVWVRLDGLDRRQSAADRDRERLALQLWEVRTRQDTDHATVSVLGQRVEEQHLGWLAHRSAERNNVLDMRRERNGRK